MTAIKNEDDHLKYLDAARGIAALMVFMAHYLDRGYHDFKGLQWAYLVFNGSDAVAFFFVLSGFVLSYKYLVLRKPLDIKKFWVSRIFRLYPAYFVTVAALMLFAYRDVLSGQKLLDLFVLNKGKFWEEAILIRFTDNYYFPGWTLGVEMIVSFLMPLFIALAVRDRRFALYLLVAFQIQGSQFFSHFVLGMVLAAFYQELTAAPFKQTRWYRWRYLLIPAAMVLYSMRHIDAISPLGPDWKYLARYIGLDDFVYSAYGSFIFIGAILISRRTQRILSGKVLVFLGKISYGIYLMHTLGIELMFTYIVPNMYIKDPVLMFSVRLVLYFAITATLATIVHRGVELPFIRIGRKVAGRMKEGLVVR